MFSHLVESDLHTGELKRKGTFFLATLAAYALLLMAAGVAGAFAYEARIEDQNLELVALVPPETNEPKPKEVRQPRPRLRVDASVATSDAGAQRSTGGLIKNSPTDVSEDLTKIAGAAKAETTQPPPIISDGDGRNFEPDKFNPFGVGSRNSGDSSGTDTNGDGSKILKEPPPPIARQGTSDRRVVNIGVVNSRALTLPEPVYPQIARAANVQGIVNVEILIDETGRVASAQATSGHPLLRQEAERAAYRARFSPTLLSQQPVKAKGVITFNFILRK